MMMILLLLLLLELNEISTQFYGWFIKFVYTQYTFALLCSHKHQSNEEEGKNARKRERERLFQNVWLMVVIIVNTTHGYKHHKNQFYSISLFFVPLFLSQLFNLSNQIALLLLHSKSIYFSTSIESYAIFFSSFGSALNQMHKVHICIYIVHKYMYIWYRG